MSSVVAAPAVSLSGAYAGFGLAALTPRTCSGCGRANAPLTRWPGEFVLGSVTASVALPAVLVTSAAAAVS